MLSKKELEEIIAAWPDENGVSCDPKTFDNWVQKEWWHYARLIRNALGPERIAALTKKQNGLLEHTLRNLLCRKSFFDISDEEIIGQYEIVTGYIAPKYQEDAVEKFRRKQKMN